MVQGSTADVRGVVSSGEGADRGAAGVRGSTRMRKALATSFRCQLSRRAQLHSCAVLVLLCHASRLHDRCVGRFIGRFLLHRARKSMFTACVMRLGGMSFASKHSFFFKVLHALHGSVQVQSCTSWLSRQLMTECTAYPSQLTYSMHSRCCIPQASHMQSAAEQLTSNALCLRAMAGTSLLQQLSVLRAAAALHQRL